MQESPGVPTYLDLDRWPRHSLFHFFRGYDQPFFNVCVQPDVTALRRLCRSEGLSFVLAYHFLALRAAQEVEPFRYRLRGERVLIHDRLDIGTTVLFEGERFAFCYFEHHERFAPFAEKAEAALAELRAGGGPLEPRDDRDDLLHCSVLPWIAFTSFAHARRAGREDSVPKLVFGQCREDGAGALRMPVSVEVHHALMDGVHVGRFLERLEASFARPEAPLGFAD